MVHLISHSKSIAKNGWLVNVSKSDIQENDYKYQIAKGKY
jgi:hypothetical protein